MELEVPLCTFMLAMVGDLLLIQEGQKCSTKMSWLMQTYPDHEDFIA
jgi:hypothetical protein